MDIFNPSFYTLLIYTNLDKAEAVAVAELGNKMLILGKRISINPGRIKSSVSKAQPCMSHNSDN